MIPVSYQTNYFTDCETTFIAHARKIRHPAYLRTLVQRPFVTRVPRATCSVSQEINEEKLIE